VTTFLLLRHALHDWVGRGIAGRQPGVSLNEEGRRQAQQLVPRLEAVHLDAIVCSPQPRTHQTAQPLASARGLDIEVQAGLDEIDMGEWQGLTFRQLDAIGRPWRDWVERRASAHPPGGEAFAGVPVRAMAALRELQQRYPHGTVLAVSHGDVIKCIVATCLRMSLDDLERFDIAPAGATKLAMGEGWMQVQLLNGLGPIS